MDETETLLAEFRTKPEAKEFLEAAQAQIKERILSSATAAELSAADFEKAFRSTEVFPAEGAPVEVFDVLTEHWSRNFKAFCDEFGFEVTPSPPDSFIFQRKAAQ